MTKTSALAQRFRITEGKDFRLEQIHAAETAGIESEKQASGMLAESLGELRDRQQKLYAQQEWALLLILQGMDAAGKDSVISHVMSGVNPSGCEVFSFKQPSSEELKHDFLWRSTCKLPERGRIGIFNRSYYEEVLVVRVHQRDLQAQRLPQSLVTEEIWRQRYEDIAAFERHLARNGTLVRKFFLHVSKAEQKKRFLARLDTPEKNWKFSEDDVKERKLWPHYMAAYEHAIRHTAAPHAPWYVVPADHKWFTRLVVASAVVEALDDLNLQLPEITRERRKELEAARAALENES